MITRTLAATAGAALLLTSCSITIGTPSDDTPRTATVHSTEQDYVDNLLSSDTGWTEDDAWYSVDTAKTICRSLRDDRLTFGGIPDILFEHGMDPEQGGTMVLYGVEAFCPELEDELARYADDFLDNH
ncbi:DUF732 domain-containing protein [Quadrisphaera sp. GCM10027208]|uniref:DUF732 domain-containing protein n=1 Tax=Quadrisphaera sp. GCM10027208 TaxID=3273423 RepID=UPI003620D45B